ncbi:hypothetical protein KSS87_014202 [Heliosperma pusillum]|nr:hypothetical protein KSS87_014202 [Heliosperma pusillum]
MENMEVLLGDHHHEAMDLPPGFRFHPTDEELITSYLYPKVLDSNFSARAIGDVDLNKCEPWELPRQAKMGEKEWYFFCVRDRKYPTGLRTNRATEAGYWKATGKDKDIFRDKSLVGMKKTLVFYKGRAPKGEKSNWVMHEYRLEGKASLQNLPSHAKNEWTICRVFQKNDAGKKLPFPGLTRPESYETEYNPSGNLPPLMESSPYNTTTTNNNGVSHVPCFSNPMNISNNYPQTSNYNNNDQLIYDGFITNPFNSIPLNSNNNYFPKIESGNSYFQSPTNPNYLMSEDIILRSILGNHGKEMKTEVGNYSASQDTGLSSDMNAEISSVVSNYDISRRPVDFPSSSDGPVDLENLWNY